ncbi:MAG: EamA family transporter, partial [Anaerolineaceae bacterium]|nr:EamA family transporter [Anaerolineaceae bacterium]
MSTTNWIKFCVLGLLWGSSFLWIKIGVQEMGPFTLVTLRVLFSLLGLGVMSIVKRPDWHLRQYWKTYLFMGLFNIVTPFVLISWSEQHIPSGLASILNSTVPLFTIILAPLFLADDKFTLNKVVGLALGFLGVVALMSNQLTSNATGSVIGMITMLLAAVSYAASAVFARRNTQGLSPAAMALGQMTMAALIIVPSAAIAEAPFTLPRLAISWVAVAWLGLLGTFVATLLFFSLLHSVGPTRTTLVSYIFPLVGVLLG